MTDAPLEIRRERDGRLLRLRLDRPKANVIDAEMIAALEAGAGDKGITLGSITPKPDPATEAIVTSWPLAMDDARARALGLPADESLERVIGDYIEDFGSGK